MRRLLGPHLGGQWANKLELLRKWQPPFVLVLQPEVEKVAQLREACPRAIITGRFYHEDSHYASNISARPKEFAREIHQEIASNPVTPLLDYVQSNNETNQDWQGIQKLNEFTLEWMALADQSGAYKCAILAFSVGNPDMPHKPGDPAGFDGHMLYWQQVLPSLHYAQANNHILLLHAYGYADMFAPDADWYIYRYERQVQANLRTLGITSLKYAYGEIGIDRLIVNGRGGYKVVTNDQDYVNQLLQWEKDLQGQNLLLGGAIFTFGDSGGWDTYDIADTTVASFIATHYVNHANEYESSPAEETNTMSEQIFFPSVPNNSTPTQPAPDLPPREWDERLTARGVTVKTPQIEPGQRYWRVAKAHWYEEQESQGRHHIYVEAPDDTPFRVVWPSGGADGWANGRSGFDAGNFPMSKSLNEFSVFIDDGKPSEVLQGIGMGANGNSGIHTSTGVTFQLTTMPQAQLQPPTEQPQPANAIGYVIARAGANLRQSPTTDSPIIIAVPFGETVRITEVANITGWVRVRYGKDEGWMASQLIGLMPPEKPAEPTPEPTMPLPVGTIDPRVLEAILQVESGGRGFGNNGLLLVRFEAHVFVGRGGNPALFRYDQQIVWADQQWRRAPHEDWRNIHTGSQDDEYAALNFAASLNREAAYQSISMGAPQVMGFHHKRLGYPSAVAMFGAFQRSLNAQIIGMINYMLADAALVRAVNERNWEGIARGYNGGGNVAEAAAKYKAAYERLG